MFGHHKAALYEREFGTTPWSLAKGMWAFRARRAQFGTPHLAGSQFGSALSSRPTSTPGTGLSDASLFGPSTANPSTPPPA